MRASLVCTALAALLLLPVSPASAQLSGPLDQATLDGFEWRSIGPSHMGGRVTDIEGVPGTHTFYVATALGGIWKTVNQGTTFFPLFTHERVISLGDIAIAPSNPDVVWAGTGEEDSRNSITAGGGVFKSTDGGLTWTDMGLEETQAVGRIVIHPTNPDVVYVAALGAPWGANPERGLYRTTDGGDTWELTKFISDEAGFVDIVMDPRDPDVLFASSWERVRRPYYFKSGGPGSGLWKTVDGGDTWTEVAGNGFPTTEKGRIGLAQSPSDPDVIYAMVEAAPEGITAEDVLEGRVDYGQAGYVSRWDGHDLPEEITERPRRLSGLYRSTDGGDSWEWMNINNNRPFYYSQVRVDPQDPDRVYKLYSNWEFSDDGGRSWLRGANGHHVDHHAMWINPDDPDHFIIGSDGGVAQTFDKGGSYDVLNHQALGQFYQVSYDMAMPYRVCGGLQDNGSWCGPSRKQSGPITATDWFNVGGGDGFWTQQDPTDPNIIYSESQGGSMSRQNIMTGERSGIRPSGFNGRQWDQQAEDIDEDDDAAMAELLEERAADSLANYSRWNWNTPIVLSPHNPNVVYAGGNRVYRSIEQGDDMRPISPDLSDQDAREIRISTQTTGGITPDVTQAETHNTVVALAESPMERGLIYAGTDDGNLWITEDDGGTWTELSDNLAAAGVPEGTWITHVEPSRYVEDRIYVAADNHFRNDFNTYVLVSEDRGRTFTPLWETVDVRTTRFPHVVREDPVNQNLLYMGTDLGIWVSLDRGANWQNFNQNLPTVPVHDLQIHPRDRELIAGTHGRSIWVVDVAPLQQLTDDVMTASVHAFESAPQFQYTELRDLGPGIDGHQPWNGDNAQYGASIRYRIAGEPDDSVRIVISDVAGETLAVMMGSNEPGLHEIVWSFRATGDQPIPQFGGGQGGEIAVPGFPAGFNPRPGEARGDPSFDGDPHAELEQGGQGGRRGGGFRGGVGGGGPVGTGQYLVTVEAGRSSSAAVLRVEVLGPVDPRESVIR
jgi:photosystem II stability/assembly factor-like uncharacterized protein